MDGKALDDLGIVFLLYVLVQRLYIAMCCNSQPNASTTLFRCALRKRLNLHDSVIGVAAIDPLAQFIKLNQQLVARRAPIAMFTPASQPFDQAMISNAVLLDSHCGPFDSRDIAKLCG